MCNAHRLHHACFDINLDHNTTQQRPLLDLWKNLTMLRCLHLRFCAQETQESTGRSGLHQCRKICVRNVCSHWRRMRRLTKCPKKTEKSICWMAVLLVLLVGFVVLCCLVCVLNGREPDFDTAVCFLKFWKSSLAFSIVNKFFAKSCLCVVQMELFVWCANGRSLNDCCFWLKRVSVQKGREECTAQAWVVVDLRSVVRTSFGVYRTHLESLLWA